MKSKEIVDEKRLNHWARIIKERIESGVSIRGYCKSIGIHENTYYYWQRKMREYGCEGFAENACKSSVLPSPVFAEVKLPGAAPQAGCDIPQKNISVEIGGLRISAGNEYPSDKLVEILRAVMQRC